MHLSDNRTPSRLPKRFPVGATYVVEGRGGEDGHLRVFSRYVVLPGGRRINVDSDCGGPAPERARRSRNRSQASAANGEKRRPSRAKKIIRRAGTTRQ
jgi:hypothetical protein